MTKKTGKAEKPENRLPPLSTLDNLNNAVEHVCFILQKHRSAMVSSTWPDKPLALMELDKIAKIAEKTVSDAHDGLTFLQKLEKHLLERREHYVSPAEFGNDIAQLSLICSELAHLLDYWRK